MALWRTIIRDCRRIADQKTRKETLHFAKEEFRRHKDVKDLVRLVGVTGVEEWRFCKALEDLR